MTGEPMRLPWKRKKQDAPQLPTTCPACGKDGEGLRTTGCCPECGHTHDRVTVAAADGA